MSQFLIATTGRIKAISKVSINQQIFRVLLRLASAALLIRVIGMLNQIVVTARFGAGAAMDAYFVASALPLLLAQLIISAIEFSVIPVYARACTEGTKEQKSRLFSSVFNLVLIGAALFTLVIIIFRSQVIIFSAPALDSTRLALAVDLAPFIFPAFFLMVVIGLLESLLITEGQFGWQAYAGVLVPFTTSLLVLLIGPVLGVVVLCIGMSIGLCLQLCLLIIRVRSLGLHYQPVIDLGNTYIVLVLSAAGPALLSGLIGQASPLVDQMFASSLTAGSISALNYSLKLISVPVGVIFVSVGRAALPYLSQQASRHDFRAFKETLRLYLWAVGIGSTVLTFLMIFLARPLVQILFQHGAFTPDDTNRTASTLIGFVIGLTPTAFCFIGAKALGALGKTKMLMYTTLFMVFANALFDFLLARIWQSFGIALGTSIVYVIIMSIQLIMIRQVIGRLDLLHPPKEIMQPLQKKGGGRFPNFWPRWTNALRPFFGLPQEPGRTIVRMMIILVGFSISVAGIVVNAVYTLRAAFGSLIILFFLRYPYVLLLAWIAIDVFIGSNVQFITGNNFLTGLTAPTIFLMFVMPIKQTFQRMPALAYLLVYLLWVFASIGISAIGVAAFLGIWMTLLIYVLVSVVVINVLTTRKRLMIAIDAILCICTLVALYGIYGYITKQNVSQDIQTKLYRISSIYTSITSFALLLSIVIPLALYRFFIVRGIRRILVAVAMLILLLALGLTFARTVFICVPISLLILLLFFPSRKMRISLLGGMLLLLVMLLLLQTVGHYPILGRFFNSDLFTLNGRIYLWQALLAHFDPTQLLGYGLQASDVLLASLRVSNTGVGVIATAPHNIFLGALYDHGIIGLTLLLLVFFKLTVNLIRGIRNTTGERRLLFATALSIFVSVLIQSLETTDLWIHSIGLYFWIIVALPFARYWYTQDQPSTRNKTAMQGSRQLRPAITRYSKQRSIHMEKPLRICFISMMFAPLVGGAEIQMERQARQIKSMGHQVTVVTLRHFKTWKRAERLNTLPIVRVGGIYNGKGELRTGRLAHIVCDIGLFFQLLRLRDTFDVIHVFQVSSLSAVAAFVGQLLHKPVIISIQNTGPDEKQRPRVEQGAKLMADTLADTSFLNIDFMDWAPGDGDISYLPRSGVGGRGMLNYLRGSNAFYLVISKRGIKYLTSYGFRPEQIVYIPYGIDTEQFLPAPDRRPDPAKPERDIICVARLEYAKGIDVLLHAWGRLMHAPSEWRTHLRPRLLLAGEGKLRQQMERIARELGIQDSVEFLGLRKDIVDLLQQSWGFVLPSRWEGLPNALLEGMACGLPCVAARASGNEDLIMDGINGLLVEAEQPAEMALALQRIIEDTSLAQRLGQEARLTVVNGYQLSSVAGQTLDLYRNLLAHRSKALSVAMEGK